MPLSVPAVLQLQRSAGNASVTRMLAREAEVDLPGWGSNLIGDDDSDVTFTPAADFQQEGFAADVAASRTDAEVYMKMTKGFMEGRYDIASMNERGGYGGRLSIKAGTKGVVRIAVKAHFFMDEKVNDTYDQEFACSWPIEADLQGKLTIHNPLPEITPIGDDEAPFQLQGLNPAQDAGGGTVQISPQFISYQFTDIPNVSLGGNFDFGVEGQGRRGGMQGNVTFGNEQTYPAGTLVRTFDVQIAVTDIPPPPEPEPEPEPEISIERSHTILFEKPKQAEVSGQHEKELLQWYMGLTEPTRTALREGSEKMKVDGYASTTDKATNNRKLARARTDAVMAILRDFGVKQFDDAAWGEYEAMEDDPEKEVEAQEGRRVTISVMELPAPTPAPDPSTGRP
jgi:outer membrane protein OmpA-like peptidoglycan-associated protein